MKYIVTGGRARGYGEKLREWQAFDRAIIAVVDSQGPHAEKCIEYITPTDLCADVNPAIVFKAATLSGSLLYVCTMTEILVYDIDSFTLKSHISNEIFNDVHHVLPTKNGTLLVANTGLDMAVEVDAEGEIVREWDVLGGSPWDRFDRLCDYRKVATTKPHASHPNFIFTYNDEIWVTRFIQKDAVCLNRPDRKIDISVGNPHDGRIRGHHVYFTTTNGHIVIADITSCRVTDVYRLTDMSLSSDVLGWCRGIEIIDDKKIVVGFTEIRETKFKKNLEWVKSRLMRRKAWWQNSTRISMYDLDRGEICWECDLERHAQMNAIFSIHALWE